MRPRPWTTLVDTASLAAALGSPDLVVLDCRHDLKDPAAGRRAWEQAHVPGAFHAHCDADLSGPVSARTGRHPLPEPTDFRATCSRWGIDEDAQVVCYDDKGGIWASRAWWLLRDYGHRAVALLDGGWPAWVAEGRPTTTAPPARAPRAFPGRPGHMPTVSAWDLTTRFPRRVLDARAPERYAGETEPIDPVAGHIPLARSAPTNANLAPDGRFLAPEELRKRYEDVLSGVPAGEAAVYCGSGATAPHDILAIEIAGLGTAKLYPGSWSHWIRDPFRPVAKGREP